MDAALTVEVTDDPSPADAALPPRGLQTFNDRAWPGHQPSQQLGVFARDGQRTVAGLVGMTYAGWLTVRYLWVADEYHRQGLGRRLMGAAEQCAIERGCHSAWLDTFSFQAPGFYRKLGYQPFGELAWSAEHTRIFLQKRLARTG